eukprot:CAMPEP_0119363404 /NCGR_PEP_ID=MMETSP1334-20130426/10319_2 /TAXON_ID=127549 /ORGANISM="Calcidiscus leptoporus, Strain RCC1130" /LENGTH=71 /DNA_ID=CAMNT_0007378851 /DNA_START=1034 /DNA_END=1249 /DNA_ORIENTATION=-
MLDETCIAYRDVAARGTDACAGDGCELRLSLPSASTVRKVARLRKRRHHTRACGALRDSGNGTDRAGSGRE